MDFPVGDLFDFDDGAVGKLLAGGVAVSGAGDDEDADHEGREDQNRENAPLGFAAGHGVL